MKAPKEKFQEFLVSKGSRMTLERRSILDEVPEVGGHFTADDLLSRMKGRRPKVSRATVYRTLDLLVGAGLVDKVDLGGQQAYYEYFYGREHHDHLICLGCGEVIEFTNRTIEDLQDEICRTHDFEARQHSHKIFGLCRRCRP